MGVHAKWGLGLAALFSFSGCWLWAWSTDSISKAGALDLFIGFCVVLAAAAGIFGIMAKAPETVTSAAGAVGGLAASVKNVGTDLVQGFKGDGK